MVSSESQHWVFSVSLSCAFMLCKTPSTSKKTKRSPRVGGWSPTPLLRFRWKQQTLTPATGCWDTTSASSEVVGDGGLIVSSNEALLPRSSKALLLDSSGAGASPPRAVPNLRNSETAAAVPSCSVFPDKAAQASRSCPDSARARGAVHASLARRMPTTLPRIGGSCV